MFLFFKVLFSGLALWWCLNQVDFPHLSVVFQELSIFSCVYALLIMCLCVYLNGLRLFYIAEKMQLKTSFKFLHRLTWSGAFFNQLLPSGIGGDAYRIYALAKKSGTLSSAAAIMWDRIIAIVCMGFVCIPMLPFIYLPTSLKTIIILIYSFLVMGVIALILLIQFPILQNYKPTKNLSKALAYGKKFASKPLDKLAIASFSSIFVNFLAFYFLVHALKIPLNFWESSAMYTVSLLVTLIPLSISGWGLRESFFTTYLLAYGFPPEKGLSLGILLGLLMLVIGIIGAVFYLFSKNQKNSLGTTAQNR